MEGKEKKEENKRILELIFYGKKNTYLLYFFKVNICLVFFFSIFLISLSTCHSSVGMCMY